MNTRILAVRTLCAICAAALILSGCSKDTPASAGVSFEQLNHDSMQALDTMIDFTIYGERFDDGFTAAKNTISRYESLMSVTMEGSDIYLINNAHGAPVSVEPHTALLVQSAKELSRLTDGDFDITVYPVVRAWGFTTTTPRIPPRSELDSLLQLVDYMQLKADLTHHTVTAPDGVMLDLGGVAKGYIGDRVIDALRDTDISSAIINLGGNVQTLGLKPDGSEWTVSVRDPNHPSQSICTVTTGEGAVITSGGYQRYFTVPDGTKYHHLIDPATGYPAQSGILSVTVVSSGSSCGFYGDGLTTALFVKGRDKSLELWRSLGGEINGVTIELIIVTTDGEVVITPGLKSRIALLTGDDYRLTVAEDLP